MLIPEHSIIWHDGATFGYNSVVAISKKYGIAVVGLTDTVIYNIDSAGVSTMDDSLRMSVLNCLK